MALFLLLLMLEYQETSSKLQSVMKLSIIILIQSILFVAFTSLWPHWFLDVLIVMRLSHWPLMQQSLYIVIPSVIPVYQTINVIITLITLLHYLVQIYLVQICKDLVLHWLFNVWYTRIYILLIITIIIIRRILYYTLLVFIQTIDLVWIMFIIN